MEYAATIVAPSMKAAAAALDALWLTASEIEDMKDGTFEALVEIDEASVMELEETGEVSFEVNSVTVTISLP